MLRSRRAAAAVALPGPSRWSPCSCGCPCCGSAQVLWQESGGDVGAVLGSAGLGTAARNTAAARRRGDRDRGAARGRRWRWSCGDRTCRAGSFWRVAVLLPIVVPDFVLGYSWTQAYARGGLHRHRARAALGRAAGPGRGVARAGGRTPRRWSTSSSAVGLAARAEPDLERAARVSGAGPATTLRHRHAAAAAARRSRPPSVLVFVLTLGTFAIPQVLGRAGRVQHGDHPDLRRPLPRRRPGVLPRGGDRSRCCSSLVTAACVAPADALLGPRLRVRPAGRPAGRPAACPAGRGRGGPRPLGAGRLPGR